MTPSTGVEGSWCRVMDLHHRSQMASDLQSDGFDYFPNTALCKRTCKAYYSLTSSAIGYLGYTPSMKFRCEIVRHGKQTKIPDGWKIWHSTSHEEKGKKPYYTILLTDEDRHAQKDSVIGFDVSPSYEE